MTKLRDPERCPRLRGRPCPAVIAGRRCNGNSEVLDVRQFDDRAVRQRRCLECGHRWRTKEIDEESTENRTESTGSTDNAHA